MIRNQREFCISLFEHSDILITKRYWNQINCYWRYVDGFRFPVPVHIIPITINCWSLLFICGSIYIEDFGSNIIHFNLMDIWYEPHLTNWLLMNYQHNIHTHTYSTRISIRIGLHLCRLIGLWFCSSFDNDLLLLAACVPSHFHSTMFNATWQCWWHTFSHFFSMPLSSYGLWHLMIMQ